MNDLELKIAEALHARPDRPVPMETLRMRAITKSRRNRRNRRVATRMSAGLGVGLAFALTAAVVAAPKLVLPQSGTGGALGLPTGGKPALTRHQGPTTLPGVNAEPTALEDPSRVGTDRGLLHFDVDLAAVRATSVEWTSGAGYERVDLAASSAEYHAVTVVIGTDDAAVNRAFAEGNDGFSTYAGGNSGNSPNTNTRSTSGPPESLTVGGRPATLEQIGAPARGTVKQWTPGSLGGYWRLRWQPVPGLQAELRVHSDDAERARATAAALRFDRVQRCLTPARLTSVPASTVVSRCDTALTRNPATGALTWASSNLWIEPTPGGHAVSFYLSPVTQRNAHDLAQFRGNVTVAGHPGDWRTADPAGLWILAFGPYEVFTSGTGLTKALAVQLTAGLIPTGNPGRPDTWPVDSLH